MNAVISEIHEKIIKCEGDIQAILEIVPKDELNYKPKTDHQAFAYFKQKQTKQIEA